jgi:hypothetical protein
MCAGVLADRLDDAFEEAQLRQEFRKGRIRLKNLRQFIAPVPTEFSTDVTFLNDDEVEPAA